MKVAGKPRAQRLSARNCFNYLTLPLPKDFALRFSCKRVYFAAIRLRPHKDMKIYESKEKISKKMCEDPVRAF